MSDAIVWMALLLYNARTMSEWHSLIDKHDPVDGWAWCLKIAWSTVIYGMIGWCSANCVVAFTKLIAEALK